ncbi:MAG TPA: response regulator [Spirochaetota bacterium]|jgi:two-component system chemotaxis response regulator CheY|nr:MAG: Sporulation initiation phosphotransferase F [Spirochaetes bacterium ADurb.Bin218]HOK93895.1 response regulator [Spirochaetota bacterium]HON17209.1 response regulator [Spirochaetota bacterium]HOQ13222.1 response regulator [Spirochaetota bacterium]HPD78637.1 response regulator [Spirochaetota bacterium]
MNRYIVVIDDSPTIRVSVEMALKQMGLPIVQAENGQDALDKISKIKGDGDDVAICISDINMPVMNGLEFIAEFRKVDKFAPVVVLTTEAEKDMIQKGKEAGASGWIIKPFQAEDLLNVVKRFVK